ncbi:MULTISPECIES: phage baseplate protein [Pseudomonas]|uniref:Baseplate structural protein Gp10 C-terminal domain-containing protein n=1 Tax=Pseudomonas putida S13.1.2 TaxID=1384061 RepID=A0AAU8RVS5_PSEPU|nr:MULTISPECIES: hypothetical protein [Pseudomonas]AJQ47966.1 hypothetical protein N805_12380 [Pseudomonas putida S13.1.2]
MDKVSAFTDLCTPSGEFRYGTQAGGVPPTPIMAEYLNLIQAELIAVVQGASIELDAEDRSQVLQAIQHLISQAGSAFVKLAGDELSGLLKVSGGIRAPKGLPSGGNASVQGYSFGADGDTGLFTVGGTGSDSSDLVMLVDGVELLRVKKSTGSVVLPGGLTLNGDKTTYNTGNKAEMLAVVYPVGSVYMNMSNSQNPAVIFGFGTWAPLGAGRVLLGAGSGTDSRGEVKAFTAGSTGGEYSHQLTVSEIPAHAHTTPQGTTVPASGGSYQYASGDDVTTSTMSNPPPSGEIGGGQAHNNMQPYLVAYMWQRTA